MDISKLKPGDEHYMAYGGISTYYDFAGAAQFSLLCALGLRAHHCLLDFGCGSLRAGRFFISYLDEARYFRIEPNKKLIEDAINNQTGKALIRVKNPRFDYNENFASNVFSVQFDFILAHSIFTHTGRDLIRLALQNFKESLKDNGIIAVTFNEETEDFNGNGWVYPGWANYRSSTIKRFAEEAGLLITRIPWYHPKQTWYILAKNKKRLLSNFMMRYLTGAVLFEPEFTDSCSISAKIVNRFKIFAKRALPVPIKNTLKRMIAKNE